VRSGLEIPMNALRHPDHLVPVSISYISLIYHLSVGVQQTMVSLINIICTFLLGGGTEKCVFRSEFHLCCFARWDPFPIILPSFLCVKENIRKQEQMRKLCMYKILISI